MIARSVQLKERDGESALENRILLMGALNDAGARKSGGPFRWEETGWGRKCVMALPVSVHSPQCRPACWVWCWEGLGVPSSVSSPPDLGPTWLSHSLWPSSCTLMQPQPWHCSTPIVLLHRKENQREN